MRDLELRKQGRSYREIGRALGVDVHTAHADVGAELHALRATAVTEATELRALELEDLEDRMRQSDRVFEGLTNVLWV